MKQIPNLLTSINILIGCIAITLAFQNNVLTASYLIFLAAFIDFLDGFMARKLNAISDFGKVLDSLADVISFGVTPAVIMYRMLNMALTNQNPTFSEETATLLDNVNLYGAYLLVVFAAIRLARFSTSESDGRFFVGLPTPAMAITIAAVAILFQETDSNNLREIILNNYFLITITLILSLLMVSHLKMFSLKFENLSFQDNAIRYIFLILAVFLLIPFRFSGILLVMLLYILISVVNALFVKSR
ncbi:MAG: CDP-alcohol phosphatidyltransferase family protein [Bacteroidota bacterium]